MADRTPGRKPHQQTAVDTQPRESSNSTDDLLSLLVEEIQYLRSEIESLRVEIEGLRVAHYVAMELILVYGGGLSPEAAREIMDELFHKEADT